jgi:hypothetical protein
MEPKEKTMRLIPTVVALAHLAAAPARAQDARETLKRVGDRLLWGPTVAYAGEKISFYTRAAAQEPVRVTVASLDGRASSEFQGSFTLEPGTYTVRLEGDPLSVRLLRVRPLPPPVSAAEPLRRRLANLQIYVQDGDRSSEGRVLETVGRGLGSILTLGEYRVTWVLAGRQATCENVRFALGELARLGYVIDVFSSVHGYPIALADGSWEVARTPGLASVRLFYTSACNGAEGAADFLNAGVKTYVAARGTNFVNPIHQLAFFARWSRRGATVRASVDEAFAETKKLYETDLGREVERRLEPNLRMDERAFEESRLQVFGDSTLTMATDPVRSTGASEPF